MSLNGCTIWTLTKCIEKRPDRNYERMLQVILKTSWKQHPTKQQLYSHLPSISKIIQIRQTNHAGHCWRSKNELISDFLPWTTSYGHASVGQPTIKYQQLLCTDAEYSLKERPEAMDDRDKWKETELGESVLAAQHDDDDDEWNFYKEMIQSLNESEYRYCCYRNQDDKSSSSSCCSISVDIPDLFSPPFSVIHCLQQVLRATSRV